MSDRYLASGSGGEPSVTASAIVAQAVGSHILRIDGYSRTKALGNGKCFKSEKFVVGGYRWWLLFYPGGVNSSYSDSISVFLHLDVDHAYVSAYEVKAKYTISLLDHDGNKVPSYSKASSLCSFSATEVAKASWGFNEFIRRSDLEESDYLKDDVFCIRCDVTVHPKQIATKAIPVPAVRRGV